jgi:hypothetical protein
MYYHPVRNGGQLEPGLMNYTTLTNTPEVRFSCHFRSATVYLLNRGISIIGNLQLISYAKNIGSYNVQGISSLIWIHLNAVI